VVGPSFGAAEVPDVIEALLDTYRVYRSGAGVRHETFIDTLRRVGAEPFKIAANGARVSTNRDTPALAVETL
jgi:sulfite reductase (NADPH) hemoprotein beta-component